MKIRKLLAVGLTVLSAATVAFSFSGCVDNSDGDLNEEKSLEIRTAFFNQFNESGRYNSVVDVKIYGYFGVYNDCWIVDLGKRSQLTVCYSATIDGITIEHPTCNRIYAYKDINFYELQEAFDSGYLTHEDLLKIKTACANDWDDYFERI